MSDLKSILIVVSALRSGLVGGIFFAFSNFVMKALARVPPTQGVAAMQSINVVVLNRWFFAVFFGTALCCLALAITSFVRWQKSGAGFLLVGSLLYLIGTILVTIACNVPLNEALAGVDPSSADSGPVWSNYLKNWTAWNHVRTVAALAAAALFIVGLYRAVSPFDFARPKASSLAMSTISAHKPEDWPRQFVELFCAGNPTAAGRLIMGDPNGRE
jgi:Predicted integral membrane protein